jgi:mannitol/fructose-specific phosphotransferase system IIA component (Ntr-type)
MKRTIKSLTSVNVHRNKIDYLITCESININFKGNSKESIIRELLDILKTNDKLFDLGIAYRDILKHEKEKIIDIPNGISVPHTKPTVIHELTITIDIKKSGLNFESPLDDKTCITILILTPTRQGFFAIVFNATENNGYSKCQP